MFASLTLSRGHTFAVTLSAAGTYPYQSTAGEPTAMSGKIIVPPA